jgi:hypothetical protein
MFVYVFSFSFDDHGLSTSLNHGWNLLSSLHHHIDDDLKGVFRYTTQSAGMYNYNVIACCANNEDYSFQNIDKTEPPSKLHPNMAKQVAGITK